MYVQARVIPSHMTKVVPSGGLEADGGKGAGSKSAKDDRHRYYSASLRLCSSMRTVVAGKC